MKLIRKKITDIAEVYDIVPASLFFAILILVIYGNVLKGDFLKLDDFEGIYNNPVVKDLKTALATYRLNLIINALLNYFFGLNKVFFHLNGLLFHCINTVLFYIMAKKIVIKKIAFLSAILFLLHPINSETVNWLSANAYLYSAFFTFVVIIFYLKAREKKIFYYLSLITYYLYIFLTITPWVVTIPFIIVILDIYITKRNGLKSTLLYFIPLVIFAVFYLPGHMTERIESISNSDIGIQKVDVILEKALTIQSSLYSLVLPYKLSVYPNNFTYNPVEYSILIISIVAICGCFYKLYKDKTSFGLLLLIYAAIIPTLIPLSLNISTANRYFYASSAFFSLLVVNLLFNTKKEKYKNEKLLIYFFIILLFSLRTFIRTFDWISDEKLWISTTSTVRNAKAYNNLGTAYLSQREYAKALKAYDNALQLRREYPLAEYNMGLVFYNIGDYQNSRIHFISAIKLDPSIKEAYYWLQMIELAEGKSSK